MSLVNYNQDMKPSVQNAASHSNKPNFIQRVFKEFNKERQLWIITSAMLLWIFIFAYIPMVGLVIAFKNYQPGYNILTAKWVGLQYFVEFFSAPEFAQIMRNTLAISGLNILLGFPAPIILALLLNEMRLKKYKKVIQTISYVPHFISWVVVASILFTILGSDGTLNKILMTLGVIDQPVIYLYEGKYFWGIITFANIWKSIGWSSIIYLSAMAGIDEELYQAGAVDGLGRFGMLRHITLPSISTTIVLLLILNIGGILNAGFEQQLLLGNDQTRDFYEVIDTYAYKYGIQQGRYGYGAAVGLMKGVISVILVFSVNYFCKKKLDTSVM